MQLFQLFTNKCQTCIARKLNFMRKKLPLRKIAVLNKYNMNQEVKKTSEIKIKVGLNEANIPVKMEWKSEDNPNSAEFTECKAMLLSFFDEKTRDTMKMDLWTTEMQIMEMDRFFYQSLRAMAETYHKATNNNELAADMQRFVQYFGEKTEILPKQ